MSEDTPTQVTSQEGNQIPVRMEGGYATYTSPEGKSLLTGEDISPVSENVGEKYEYNPEKAHIMAKAEDPYRQAASNAEGWAQNFEKVSMPDDAQRLTGKAEGLREAANLAGEEAGKQYDAERPAEAEQAVVPADNQLRYPEAQPQPEVTPQLGETVGPQLEVQQGAEEEGVGESSAPAAENKAPEPERTKETIQGPEDCLEYASWLRGKALELLKSDRHLSNDEVRQVRMDLLGAVSYELLAADWDGFVAWKKSSPASEEVQQSPEAENQAASEYSFNGVDPYGAGMLESDDPARRAWEDSSQGQAYIQKYGYRFPKVGENYPDPLPPKPES